IKRQKAFAEFIRDRLVDAEEVAIPPNLEEGVEVGVVVLTILKHAIQICRNFDKPKGEDDDSDELKPGEWIFLETAEDSKVGLEVYVKYEGLKARILDQMAFGNTETKITRKEVVRWLLDRGRYHDKNASVNRRRCAYVLPYDLVQSFEIFRLRVTANC